jgi:precorrin-3B C17-methyltransferase / cobalt-factor III methyltransferase
LKSWATIERRLKAAAEANFVIALYNAASKARPHQLNRAFDLLRILKGGETVTLFVRAAGTAEAKVTITTLAEADARSADMRTLVIVGASTTRLVYRAGQLPFVYTPRSESS